MSARKVRCQTVVGAALLLLVARPASAQAPRLLTLGGAARLAANQGAGLAAARFRVDAARARVLQQHAELLPTVSGAIGEGERTFNTASLGLDIRDPATGRGLFAPTGEVRGPVRTWDARGTVRQNLVDFSAFARGRAARGEATVSAVAASKASQDAATAAAFAYVEAQRADALLAARETDSTLAADLLALARDQLAAGMGTALDVTRAEAQLANTRAQLITARTERDRARLRLARVLELPFGPSLVLADSLDGVPPPDPDTVVEAATRRALRTRADLRLLDAQQEAGRRRLTAINAERLPAVSAFADKGRTGPASGQLRTTYAWGVQLSVPLFDGFRREGRIAEQRAAVNELDASRHDAERQVLLEVREALLDVTASREQVVSAGERLVLAERELTQARGRYAAGIAGNADVIAALLGLNAARAQLVDARAAAAAARVARVRAQGAVTELP